MKSMIRNARLGLGLAIVVLTFVVGLPHDARAQGKMGWVDLDRILSEYKEFQTAEDQFKKDAATWEANFDSAQEVYFGKVEDYKKQQLLLSEQTRKTREDELAAMEKSLMDTKSQLESQAEKRRSELTNPILQKIQDVVKKVATDEDYDFVFNASQIYMTPAGIQFAPIMYAKKKLDLTDRVLEELGKLK
ncbi:MAG: OmpH family outer membrane protein [candidate division Zixibacteria bacterium]|nr:OmpH family outer membrane protein [candidate division Zixibacteria bacterium]